MKRARTFTPVTSRIEQSFGKLLRTVDDSRRKAKELRTDRVNALVLAVDDLHPSEVLEVCAEAQRIYAEICPAPSRTHRAPRIDKGIARGPCKRKAPDDAKPTETAFCRAFHQSVVDGHSSKSTRTAPSGSSSHVAPLWTERHQREYDFQQQKRWKRRVEEHLSFDIVADPGLIQPMNDEIARRHRSLDERLRKEAKMSARLQPTPPTPDELHGQVVHVESGTGLPSNFAGALASQAMQEGSITDASVWVTGDPWEPSELTQWGSVLKGGWILTPEVLLGTSTSPAVKHLSALKTRRTIYVSQSFMQGPPVATKIWDW